MMKRPKRFISKAGIDFIGLGVAAVVFNDDRKIALLRRAARAGKGLWSLPGGRVRIGESLEAAIVREVREEIGVHCSVRRGLGLLEDIGTEGHWISAIFVVGDVIGDPYNKEPRFHSALQWCSVGDVPADLTLVARTAIERLT
jgi:ADP-ribose pyrophosphatase YjhB (NUDIX family)